MFKQAIIDAGSCFEMRSLDGEFMIGDLGKIHTEELSMSITSDTHHQGQARSCTSSSPTTSTVGRTGDKFR